MQAVILCGGLATRMGGVIKSLVSVRGRAFIDWQIDKLVRAGFTDIVLSLGYGADEITKHIEARIREGDFEAFGSIAMCADGNKIAKPDGATLLGTMGAIRHAHALELLDEEFVVTYGDSFIDYRYAVAALQLAQAAISNLAAVVTVCKNPRFFRGNVKLSLDDKFVRDMVKGERVSGVGSYDHVDYGAIAMRRSALEEIPAMHADLNLELGEWARKKVFDSRGKEGGLVRALIVPEYFHEIGSPEGLSNLEAHLGRKDSIA